MANDNKNQIIVQESFCISPFYIKGDRLELNSQETVEQGAPFYFDIVFNEQPSFYTNWPWQDPNVPKQILYEWKIQYEELSKLFRERKKEQVKPLMRKGIAYFIELVFWSHEKPVPHLDNLAKEIDQLSFIPVNLTERLTFLRNHSNHHLSFIQLNELFLEQEKKIARARITKRK